MSGIPADAPHVAPPVVSEFREAGTRARAGPRIGAGPEAGVDDVELGAGVPGVDDVGPGDESLDVPLRLRLVPSEGCQEGVVGVYGNVDGHTDCAGDATLGVRCRTFEFWISFTSSDRLTFEGRPLDQTFGEAGGVIDDGGSIALWVAGGQDPAVPIRGDPAVHARGGVGDKDLRIRISDDVSGPDRGRFGPDRSGNAASIDDHGLGVGVEDVAALQLQVDVTKESERDPLQRAGFSVLHGGEFAEINSEGLALHQQRIAMGNSRKWSESVLRWFGSWLDARVHRRGDQHGGSDGNGDFLVDLHWEVFFPIEPWTHFHHRSVRERGEVSRANIRR